MKVNYPRSRSQSGSEPERNRAHSGRGCPTTSGLGLGHMCPAPVIALKSGPGSAAWGSPLPKKSPPPATGSQKPLESSSHAQHAEKGAQRRPEEADVIAAPTPGQRGPPKRPRSTGPTQLKPWLPAARARAQTQGRARARAHSPGYAAAAAAAPERGRSGAPPPLRASASGTAARVPPAVRAARHTPRSRPRAGSAPRGHPTRRSRPPGALRGQEGRLFPALCAAKPSWERPFISGALSRDAAKRLRACQPRAAILGLWRIWGGGRTLDSRPSLNLGLPSRRATAYL